MPKIKMYKLVNFEQYYLGNILSITKSIFFFCVIKGTETGIPHQQMAPGH